MITYKYSALAAVAGVAGAVASALGGWDAALEVLVGCIAADYVTGLMLAGVFKRSAKSGNGALSSASSFKGLCKKAAIILAVWISAMLDRAMGVNYVRTTVVIFFIGNEGLSVLENLGLMGVPYPKFLKDALAALREKGDGGESK